MFLLILQVLTNSHRLVLKHFCLILTFLDGHGVIRVASDLSIHTPATFDLILVASDLSVTPLTSTVTMQIAIVTGSDQPRFGERVYEVVVGVNTPVGGVVGEVRAEGECLYEIVGEYLL